MQTHTPTFLENIFEHVVTQTHNKPLSSLQQVLLNIHEARQQ